MLDKKILSSRKLIISILASKQPVDFDIIDKKSFYNKFSFIYNRMSPTEIKIYA